ncbi:MAG: MBL fold metallo-hydrolase [Planctomycetota bacterium]|jgi:L-ascorbate metabolism protein UlaG (beta-lactamase superfamily)
MREHTTIKWLGNSCFLATGKEGTRVLIDPFSRRWALEDRYGLREPRIPADIVLVTHEDSDHNALDIVPGSFFVVRGNMPEQEIFGVTVNAFSTFHGVVDGTIVKDNTVFQFELDGISFCHMGDFFAYKHRSQPGLIKGTDVLMIPIGGRFSLDWEGAREVVENIAPKVTIPMHYDEFGRRGELLSVDGFIMGRDDVVRLPGATLELTDEVLSGAPRVFVPTYEQE